MWEEVKPPDPEREHNRNHITPRKHVQPPTWRFSGVLGDARIDPTAWTLRAWRTLSEPHVTAFSQMKNRNIYSALLSGLFHADGDAYAFPHAFARAAGGRAEGCWRSLLPVTLSQWVPLWSTRELMLHCHQSHRA